MMNLDTIAEGSSDPGDSISSLESDKLFASSSSLSLPLHRRSNVNSSAAAGTRLSGSSSNNSRNLTTEQMAIELERALPLRDNRWRLRTYKNTFVGTEAVDFMVRSGLASSRTEAVELGRRLVAEFNLFEHVVRDHEFKDEHLFYRFVEPERRTSPRDSARFSDEIILSTSSSIGSSNREEPQQDPELMRIAEKVRSELEVHSYRMFHMKIYKDCFLACDAVTYLVEEGLAKTRSAAVILGRRLETELHLWSHADQKLKFNDEHLFFRFHDAGEHDSSSRSFRSSSDTGRSLAQLSQIASLLKRGLEVKKRTYRLKSYAKCFVASHAVDYMVKEGFCTSREEAVELGKELQNRLGLWHHVCNDHEFEDQYLFFRFSYIATAGSTTTDEESHSLESHSTAEDSHASHVSLSDIASKLIRGLNVKDRSYKLKKYRNCFIGYEAVDFMVQAQLVSSREGAVALGKQLMESHNLFYHVKRAHSFEDDFLFYRFSDDATSASDSYDCSSSDASLSLDEDFPDEINEGELIEIGRMLHRGVRIQNRSYRFKTFRNCFIASEAVDFLVQSKIAESREYAVVIGKRLEEELGLFHHVTRDHSFTDDNLFFRFDTTAWNANQDVIAMTVRESMSEFNKSAEIRGMRVDVGFDKSLRSAETKQLKDCANHIKDDVCMVMIGGPSGCGKRALIESTFSDNSKLIFASATFETTESSPFATLRLLFSELCRQVANHPKICENLASMLTNTECTTILRWVPEFVAFVPGAEDANSEANDVAKNQGCIKHSLLSFIEAICDCMPVVLLLDDIMNAESCTLEILDFILKGCDRNLLLCANYSESSVENDSRLMQWKEEIAKFIKVKTISLKNLETEQIRAFLSHTLRLDESEVDELAVLMKKRTDGNFYFLNQLLETLQNLNLLSYNFATLKWSFSVEAIRKKTSASDNVGMLLAMRITQLSRCVEQTLKLASCFGSSFDPEVLKEAKSVLFVFDDILFTLSEACKEGLLIRITDREYKFAHIEVKKAAYKLLRSEEERKSVHFEIGLALSTKESLLEDDEALFACVDQIIQSQDRMHDLLKAGMKVRIARLFLRAGKSAMELSAFLVASKYLKAGSELLGENAQAAFRDHYDIALQLFSTHAQAELSSGCVEASRKAAQAVLDEARRQEDKQSASRTLFRCFTAEGKLKEQCEFALRLLETAGHKFPKDPNFLAGIREWEKTRPEIKSDENVLSLPLLTDQSIDFCYDILTDLILTSNATGRHFELFATARMVQMTLKHGLSKFTPLIFVLLGQGFIAIGNDLREGKRMIELSFQVKSAVGAAAKGRLLTQACMVSGCVQAISQCMYLALDGYKACMEIGDIQNAFHGARVYLWSFYYSGLPFEPLLDDVEKFALQMLDYKQYYLFHMVTPLYQLLLNLQGNSDDPSDIETGRAMQLGGPVPVESENGRCWEFIRAYGMELAFFLGDLEKATKYYEALKDLDIGFVRASLRYQTQVFFFALICIENYRVHKRIHFRNEAKKHIDFLKVFVDQGAVNLQHKYQIAQAALLSLAPKEAAEVIQKYDRAIALASRTGFIQDSAVASYLCAQFCLGQPDYVDSAGRFLHLAHDQYLNWGAKEVARRLQARHKEWFTDSSYELSPRRSGGGLRSRTHFRPSLQNMHKSLSVARRITTLNTVRASEKPPEFTSFDSL